MGRAGATRMLGRDGPRTQGRRGVGGHRYPRRDAQAAIFRLRREEPCAIRFRPLGLSEAHKIGSDDRVTRIEHTVAFVRELDESADPKTRLAVDPLGRIVLLAPS